MKIVNFSEQNSIINQYMAEIRDVDYQKNRLLFRNNIMRIGEFEAFELSKTLEYSEKEVATPLGIAKINVPTDKIVLATIFRAGLPFHNGFLNVFDHAGNAFVSAYREYKDEEHHEVNIHIEYLATPSIDEKNLIIADPCWLQVEVWNLVTKHFSLKVLLNKFTFVVSLQLQKELNILRTHSLRIEPQFGVQQLILE